MDKIVASAVYVNKIYTLVDGGIRVTIDLPESDTEVAFLFMECKRWGIVGKLIFEPLEQEDKQEVLNKDKLDYLP